MTASLRNQRVRLYGGDASDTNGVPSDLYTFTAERWGRRTFLNGRSVFAGLKLERQADAAVELSNSVAVPNPGVLVVNSEQYRVVEVLPRDMLASQVVLCNRVQGAQVTLVES